MRGMSLRIAYFGPAGTFTEAALRQLYTEDQAEAVPFPTIMATLDAVREGVTDRGVVPLENSVEGAVTATLDELATGRALIIRTEILLPVAFALLGREGTDLAEIKVVSGHPQAQAQCRQWLNANLPHAEWRPASSNAEAARQAAEGQIDGALAGEFAASVYGLAVLARNVHDRATAVTRFVEVSLPGQPPPADRCRPHLGGRLPGRRSPGRADGDPDPVRRPRGQPDQDRVPAHRRAAGQVLLLHRLRGPRLRRPRRRGADGPAPGLQRRPVPGQLPVR